MRRPSHALTLCLLALLLCGCANRKAGEVKFVGLDGSQSSSKASNSDLAPTHLTIANYKTSAGFLFKRHGLPPEVELTAECRHQDGTALPTAILKPSTDPALDVATFRRPETGWKAGAYTLTIYDSDRELKRMTFWISEPPPEFELRTGSSEWVVKAPLYSYATRATFYYPDLEIGQHHLTEILRDGKPFRVKSKDVIPILMGKEKRPELHKQSQHSLIQFHDGLEPGHYQIEGSIDHRLVARMAYHVDETEVTPAEVQETKPDLEWPGGELRLRTYHDPLIILDLTLPKAHYQFELSKDEWEEAVRSYYYDGGFSEDPQPRFSLEGGKARLYLPEQVVDLVPPEQFEPWLAEAQERIGIALTFPPIELSREQLLTTRGVHLTPWRISRLTHRFYKGEAYVSALVIDRGPRANWVVLSLPNYKRITLSGLQWRMLLKDFEIFAQLAEEGPSPKFSRENAFFARLEGGKEDLAILFELKDRKGMFWVRKDERKAFRDWADEVNRVLEDPSRADPRHRRRKPGDPL